MKYLKRFEVYESLDLRGLDYIKVCIAMFAPKEYYKVIGISICEMYLFQDEKVENGKLFYTQDPRETSIVGKPFFGTLKNGEIEFSGVRESLLDGKNELWGDKGLTCEDRYQDEAQFAIIGFDEDGHKKIAELIGDQFKIRSGSESKTPGIWGKNIKHPLFEESGNIVSGAREQMRYSWDLDFPEKEEEFDEALSFVNKFAVPTFKKN